MMFHASDIDYNPASQNTILDYEVQVTLFLKKRKIKENYLPDEHKCVITPQAQSICP
jgi:hypothetical protein